MVKFSTQAMKASCTQSLLFFFFLFFYCGVICAQTTVQIGSGTLTTANAPYNGAYNYSWAQMIFLQTEIGNSGTITSIQFQVASVTGPYTMNNQLIYARLTATSSLSGGTYPGTAGFTQVYNGSITYSATGWITLNLSTPFYYDNVNNLELLFENRDATSAAGNPTFYYMGTATACESRDFAAAFPSACSLCASVASRPNIRFTMNMPGGYCSPAYSQGCTDGTVDVLNRVKIGTLDNTAAGTGATTTTVCATHFVDYTTSVAAPNLTQGTAYTLSVTVGTDASNYTAAWFDFNGDADFADAGEYFNLGNPGSSGTATVSVTIPVSATPGKTRMRIRGGEDNSIDQQLYCCSYSPSFYGEAEDYLVNIVSSCAAITIGTHPSNSCVSAGGNTTFSVTVTGATSYQWQVSTDAGTTWSNLANGGNYSGVTTTALSVNGVPGGFNGYLYRCRCTNGCSAYSGSAYIAVGAVPSAPTANAATNVSGSGFMANWSSVAGATSYLLDLSTSSTFTAFVTGYQSLDVGNVTSKMITGLACSSTYYYRLYAVNSCGTSAASNTITRATSSCGGDNCSSPIALGTISATCATQWYSNALATASTTTTTCKGTGTLDLWFSFVAPTPTVTIDMMGGALVGEHVFDVEFEVYSGACAALTCLTHQDCEATNGTESVNTYTLTPGATYLIRAANYNDAIGTFGLCVTSGTTAAADAPANAIALTNYDCYPHDTRKWVFCSTSGMTNVGEPAVPACWTPSVTANQTIWFKFTATSTAQLITTDWYCSGITKGATDNRIAVYNAALTTLMGCLEDVHNSTYTPSSTLYAFENPYFASSGCGGIHDDKLTALTVTGLTVGSTYYIRVDAASGIVGICTEPAPSNDGCATAKTAVVGTIYRDSNTGGSPWTNNSVSDNGFSGTTTQNMMFYKFTAPATDAYYINQWSPNCDMNAGTQFIIWKSTYNCGNIILATSGTDATSELLNNSTSSMSPRNLLVNFTAGQTYYIAVDGGSGDECSFQWELSQTSPVSLPVELLDFTAQCLDGKIKAVWRTATEQNNDYFILERSTDGTNFLPVTQVKGAGNSSTQNKYEATVAAAEGANYYRLRQVDFNGEFTYSKTMLVECKATGFSVDQLTPNPADNYIDVYYASEKADHIIFELYDMFGQKVLVENELSHEGSNTHRISLAGVKKGVYAVRVISSAGIYSGKVIKS